MQESASLPLSPERMHSLLQSGVDSMGNGIPEAYAFLLQYQPTGTFDDTLCYFNREGDHMTVFYPWTLTAVKAAP